MSKTYKKEWYIKNRERCIAKNRAWYKKNRARVLERSRARYRANPEHYINRTEIWRKKVSGTPHYKKRMRKNWLNHAYGLTQERFDALLQSQGGGCAICGKKGSKPLHVDHCHNTKKIRGLLCHKCNHGLGCFKDSIKLLSAAIEYLESSS